MNLSGLTQTQAAALLSIAPRTLRDWSDAPRNEDGSYPGPALVTYYVARRFGAGEEFDDQRQRLAAAQAERVEHDNAVRRGELAQKVDVTRFWAECVTNMKQKAMAMGQKLAPRLVNIGDANIIATAIRAEVRAFLAELVDYEPSGVVAAAESGEGTAAGTDGEPVGGSRAATLQRKQRRARAVAN